MILKSSTLFDSQPLDIYDSIYIHLMVHRVFAFRENPLFVFEQDPINDFAILISKYVIRDQSGKKRYFGGWIKGHCNILLYDIPVQHAEREDYITEPSFYLQFIREDKDHFLKKVDVPEIYFLEENRNGERLKFKLEKFYDLKQAENALDQI